jgi:hypothetical protein
VEFQVLGQIYGNDTLAQIRLSSLESSIKEIVFFAYAEACCHSLMQNGEQLAKWKGKALFHLSFYVGPLEYVHRNS